MTLACKYSGSVENSGDLGIVAEQLLTVDSGIKMYLHSIPSRELTYPTLGPKENHPQTCLFGGTCFFVSRRACGASEDNLTSNLKRILIFDRFYVLFSMKTPLLIFDENPTGLCVQDCLLAPLLGR